MGTFNRIDRVINGKAGKAAALPKFSGTLSLSQSEGADYGQSLALTHLKIIRDYTPVADLDGSLKSNNYHCDNCIFIKNKSASVFAL
jgi:hypothetical protein